MKLLPVKSSNIKAVGYNRLDQVLLVEFIDGKIYKYLGVEERIFNALLNVESKGTYFHRNIRPFYKAIPITGEDLEKIESADPKDSQREKPGV